MTSMTKRLLGDGTRARRRSVLDASFYELRRQLTYTTSDRGTELVIVSRWFPSSKKCSKCGETRATLSPSEHVFECRNCGFTGDRDVNASHNLESQGSNDPCISQ